MRWGLSSAVTVIELLVTVIIVGIVAAIGTFSFLHALEVGHGRTAETTLRAIFEAQRAYAFDQATVHYGSLIDLEDGRYLSGALNSIEWAYTVTLPGAPNATYTATATRQRGPYNGQTRQLNETGAVTPSSWPP